MNRKETVSPHRFLIIAKEQAGNIRRVTIIPPKLGDGHFGRLRVEYKKLWFQNQNALFGNSYRYDEGLTGTDIDRDALASDWQRVGEDIRAAMAEMAEMDEPTFSVRPIR
jgi:hypothetical protein